MNRQSRLKDLLRTMTLLIIISINASPAHAANDQTATLTYPVAASRLGSSQMFWWTPVDGAHGYWLLLKDRNGTAYSDYVIYPPEVSSAELHDLPQEPLTAELYTIFLDSNGNQNWNRVAYADLNAPASTIIEPFGDNLSGSDQLFRWDNVSAANSYYLEIRDQYGTVFHSASHALSTQTWVSGLPTDGRKLNATLHTIIDGNWDRKSTTSYSTDSMSTGTITTGFDWDLPAYANSNPSGGLVRSQWEDDIAATDTAMVDIIWRDSYQNGNYNFSSFQKYLDDYSHGDHVVVRLGVNSRCDLPDEWRYNDKFGFYAGNSIAFWQWSYLDELQRFVNAFAAEYAANERVVGVYLGIADGEYKADGQLIDYCANDDNEYWTGKEGWGEFWMDETELSSAANAGLISADMFYWATTSIIDIYLNAFNEYRNKLAFMNFGTFTDDDEAIDSQHSNLIKQIQSRMPDLVDYVLGSGIGNRDGQIEFWMRYNQKAYGVQFRAGNGNACYHEINEGYADWQAGRYSGTENEEYGYGWQNAWLDRYGPLHTQNYRFLISSLRALQMRRNYMTFDTEGFAALPDSIYRTHNFVDYVSRTLGRTKQDTPDVFVMLGERYLDQGKLSDYNAASGELGNCADGNILTIREFGRWLTETEGGGSAANQIKLDEFNDSGEIANNLPRINGSTKYEYQTRRHNSFKLNINDEVTANRCGSWCQVDVKVVYYDEVATTLSLRNQFGRLSSVETTGSGGFKTATFTVNSNFSNSFEGVDFAVETASASQPLPVAMIRVNFSQP